MQTAFVSGAAIGQGNLLAKKLAARGWRVFAGVLPGAQTDLKSVNGIELVEQDVSDYESVRASAATVAQTLGDQPLHLLMNVAGVANIATGTIEGMKLEELQRLFAINTFGQAASCQCFLPMLRRAGPQAKILNFGSGAVVANPPGAGAYTMSKHAVHGLTMTLRLELAPFGVQVTSIWPGAVKTAMTANSGEVTAKVWAAQPPAVQEAYAPMRAGLCEELPKMIEKYGNSADDVTDEVLKLVDKARLKPSYLVGKDAKPLGPLQQWLPNAIFEKIIRGSYKIPAAAKA